MPLGPEFVGAWARRSIAIDDGPPSEPARVLWLQAGDAFADLRVPLAPGRPANSFDGVDAFAGVTTYDAPALTWHHTIDWRGTFAGYDCGVVEHDGNTLIERGEFRGDDGAHTYVEVWERVDDGAEGLVLTTDDAVAVRAGSYFLALHDRRTSGGRFGVRHAQLVDDAWTDVDVLGDGAQLPDATSAVRAARSGLPAVDLAGRTWHVAERWCAQR